MRSALIASLATVLLAACNSPTAEQAAIDTRYDPVRADTMLAVGFAPGSGLLDSGQAGELRTMVAEGQRARRDEFVVVTDGSGGPIQQARAASVRQSLINAGAHWVGTALEPAMAMGPDQVVVVRSEYRIASRNCPGGTRAMWNPNEAPDPNTGCADAYNMGQMLARPRDAAVGRDPGPADATVNATAIQRYREGRVRTITIQTNNGTTTLTTLNAGTDVPSSGGGISGGGGGAGGGSGGGAPSPPAN
jgi:type IV pilus biogenesis protein CpaD/CtpE